jgi:hypothetical protein
MYYTFTNTILSRVIRSVMCWTHSLVSALDRKWLLHKKTSFYLLVFGVEIWCCRTASLPSRVPQRPTCREINEKRGANITGNRQRFGQKRFQCRIGMWLRFRKRLSYVQWSQSKEHQPHAARYTKSRELQTPRSTAHKITWATDPLHHGTQNHVNYRPPAARHTKSRELQTPCSMVYKITWATDPLHHSTQNHVSYRPPAARHTITWATDPPAARHTKSRELQTPCSTAHKIT